MLLARLRSDTAPLHARVEAAMPSLDTLATPAGYATALRALHGFHSAWEPALWAAPGMADAGVDAARKLPLLEADLRALGLTPVGRPPAPAPAGDAEALGALYVLEGAGLGGRVILRHVAGPLGVTETTGAAYYTGYGDETGPRWKAFTAALEAFGAGAGRPDRVVAGAVACFGAMERWLRTPGVVAPAAEVA